MIPQIPTIGSEGRKSDLMPARLPHSEIDCPMVQVDFLRHSITQDTTVDLCEYVEHLKDGLEYPIALELGCRRP